MGLLPEPASIGDHFYTTNTAEREKAIADLDYTDESIACYLFKEVSVAGVSANTVAFYRLYNQETGDHFYTTSLAERTYALTIGYQDDEYCHIYESEPSGCMSIAGYIFPTKVAGTVEFYRLYNPENGDHFYTISEPERAHALTIGYQDDGYCHIYEGQPSGCISIAGYVFPTQQYWTVPLYRLYLP